jgi:hypothetical protein
MSSLSLDSISLILRLMGLVTFDDVREALEDDTLSDDECDAIIAQCIFELIESVP